MGVRFLPCAKKMGNPKFFEIGPRLDTAPGAFLNRTPSNQNTHKIDFTSARYTMIVLIFIVFQRGRQW